MDDGRNILSDDKAKALLEIIEQEEAERAEKRNCTNCRKWAECMEGPLTPGEMRHATCWVPESRAKKLAVGEQEESRRRRAGMTLDEAIRHCREQADKGCDECAAEHEQLAKWLEELQVLRRASLDIERRARIEAARIRAKAVESTVLEKELAQKRHPIIAVDFDGTLCEQAWPGIGAPKWETIQALIAAQAAGARLILWTNRIGGRLREAVEWCRVRELEFDAINENLPETLAAFTTDCRKVYADIYLDDKAAQPSTVLLETLWETARGVMNGEPEGGEQDG